MHDWVNIFNVQQMSKSRKPCILMVFIMHTSGNKGREKISKIITKKLLYKKHCSQNIFPVTTICKIRFDQCLLKQLSPILICYFTIFLIVHFYTTELAPIKNELLNLFLDFSEMSVFGWLSYTAVILNENTEPQQQLCNGAV